MLFTHTETGVGKTAAEITPGTVTPGLGPSSLLQGQVSLFRHGWAARDHVVYTINCVGRRRRTPGEQIRGVNQRGFSGQLGPTESAPSR